MKITNKFNISEKAFKGMIDAGIIPCQWATYEEIYAEFMAAYASNSCRTCIYSQLSVKHGCSERTVQNIVLTMSKM